MASKYSKEFNKSLVEKYPFLILRNKWTDKIPDNYDYFATELDDMPEGWRIAFGEQLCADIRESLAKCGNLSTYRILQIKEKFGELCWYDCNGNTEIRKVILPKYVDLSKKTCIVCGKSATHMSLGWVSPYCQSCANAILERTNGGQPFMTLEDYYTEIGSNAIRHFEG